MADYTIADRKKLAAYIALGAVGAAPRKTVLLAHLEGADTATTSTDEIPGVTHALSGGAEIDTAVAKFGSASVLLDAVGAELAATGVTLDSTQPWTLEFWHYSTDDANRVYVGLYDGSDNIGARMSIDYSGANSLAWLVFNASASIIVNDFGLAPGAALQWNHYAICYDGTNFYAFRNGTRLTHSAPASTMRAVTKVRLIGNLYASGLQNIDEVRVSRVARYANAASMTVPTAALARD